MTFFSLLFCCVSGQIFVSLLLHFSSLFHHISLTFSLLIFLNRTWVFQGHGASFQAGTMLLDESHQRLYVGARNALFSLSLDRITSHPREVQWASTEAQIENCLMKGREKTECANYIKVLQQYNQSHLLVCGTGAFNPLCTFVRVGHTGQVRTEESVSSGKGRCPYDPNSPCTSTLSYLVWKAHIFSLTRLIHSIPPPRVCRLPEPKFVGSAVIPDNDDREDDKVYFFFTERELDPEGAQRAVYTRVGRVCANDQGGQRMLVNRWSSFLKTRLVCSVAGPNGIDTHFDELEDVFVLRNKDEKNPEIFGLFSTTSAVFKGYAVCIYNMEDIRAAFNGPFAYRERPEHHWSLYEERIPYPRPGSVRHDGRGFSSSKEFPDEVLRFVRSHPVMYRAVLPRHRRPVLLQAEPGARRLTQIAVDRVQAQDGHYHVIYIGTDDSAVLKFITIYNKDTDTMEEVLLEELQVFKLCSVLYVGSEVGVAQLRLHQCDLYGSECADCCLARDPYCAWDGLTCSRFYPAGFYTKRSFSHTHTHTCEQWQRAEERLVYAVESNSTLLECVPRSLQAQSPLIRGDERVILTSHGLLFLRVKSSDAGAYVCQTVEHGYVHTLLRVTIQCLPSSSSSSSSSSPGPSISPRALAPSSGHNSRLWYKDFLQLIGYGDAQRIEEYCERVWCSDKKRKKPKRRYVMEKREKRRNEEGTNRAPRHTTDT
uniref:Sema domain, immunoglobulin domain (Ig), short basic domain, secreted, (semaphorin) 3E n=1 Tax=Neogobius melanostomus TaxID=47308 RepID=A0A8C6SKP3_9GOBI